MISAGLGSVPVAQTFLDIGQGNRVNENLYDGELPRLYVRDGRVPPRLWDRIVDAGRQRTREHRSRAARLDAGATPACPVAAEADSGLATLIGVDEDGAVPIARRRRLRSRLRPGLSVDAHPPARAAAAGRRRSAPTTC